MEPYEDHRLLTTAEVGHLLQVDPGSVVKWVNDGLLSAFRTPGGHRRIQVRELRTFIKRHNMFVPPEIQGTSRFHLLVVDDDARFLSALARSLKSFADKLELETCQSGIEALLRVGKRRPDGVVLDIQMEELDGLETCRRLWALPGMEGMEVVLITGQPPLAWEKKALEAGARALLAKPITGSQLLDAFGLRAPAPTTV